MDGDYFDTTMEMVVLPVPEYYGHDDGWDHNDDACHPDCSSCGGPGSFDCNECLDGSAPFDEDGDGFGYCGDYCAPDCPDDWISDGVCDSSCLNADCSYDGGDCDGYDWGHYGDGHADSGMYYGQAPQPTGLACN